MINCRALMMPEPGVAALLVVRNADLKALLDQHRELYEALLRVVLLESSC